MPEQGSYEQMFQQALGNLNNSVQVPSAPVAPQVQMPSSFSIAPTYTPIDLSAILNHPLTNADMNPAQVDTPVPASSADHGLIGNIWSGIVNGYEHAKGALEGLLNPALQQSADQTKSQGPLNINNPNVYFDGHGLRYKDQTPAPNILDRIGQMAGGFWHGLTSPTDSQQQFNQNLRMATNGAAAGGLANFGLSAATDPLSYVPVGTIARVTGIAPTAKYLYDLAKGTVKGGDAAKLGMSTADAERVFANEASAPVGSAFKATTPAQQAQSKLQDLLAQAEQMAEAGKDNLPKVGDLVHPTSADGTLLTKDPVKVLAQYEHNGNPYYALEGTNTSFPVNQLLKAEPLAQEGAQAGFQLPKELAGAKPRYNYGQQGSYTLNFTNDLDKAAFIVRNGKNLSAKDSAYLQALLDHTGLSEPEIRSMGQQVADTIKGLAKADGGASDVLHIPPVLNATGKAEQAASSAFKLTPYAPVLSAAEHLQNLAGGNDALSALLDTANGAKSVADMGGVASNAAKPNLVRSMDQLFKPSATAAEDATTGAANQVAASAAQAGKGPYAAYNWQSRLGGKLAQDIVAKVPNGIPIFKQLLDNPVTNQIGKMFVKYYGASPDMVSALNSAEAEHAANASNIIGQLANLKGAHGLSDDQAKALAFALDEGIEPTDPKMKMAYKDLRDMLDNGIQTPEGRTLGTNYEKNTMFNGKPLLQDQVANYFPHRYNNSAKEIADALEQAPGGGVLSANGAFNTERKFATLKDAIASGLNPELDPYTAIAQRLLESSKASTNAKLITQLRQLGLSRSAEGVANEVKNVKTGMQDFSQASLGLKQSTAPQLQGHFFAPHDLDALEQYMKPNQTPGALGQLINGATSLYKKGLFFNPMVHGHNILYNGMYLAGAHPADVINAFKNIKNGVSLNDPWYQQAMRDGAISSDKGSFMTQLKKSFNNAKPSSMPAQMWNKLSYAMHGSLWDLDGAIRTAIYKDGVERLGLTGKEAAARVNKYMVNYNNLTPFEQKYMTKLFPFYNWLKGNMPLQVERWINATPQQMLYEHAKDAISQSLSGNSTGTGKIDTGIKLPDGSHVMIDPYSPSDDPLKMLKDGVVPFLYGKANPILKEGLDQFTNSKYYPNPALAPKGEESMGDTKPSNQIRLAGANNNVANTIAHLVNNLGSPLGGTIGTAIGANPTIEKAIGADTKAKPQQTAVEDLTRLLGGFASRVNPAVQAYYQQKASQAQLLEQIQALHNAGKPVPQSLTSAAYKKLKFPTTANGQ